MAVQNQKRQRGAVWTNRAYRTTPLKMTKMSIDSFLRWIFFCLITYLGFTLHHNFLLYNIYIKLFSQILQMTLLPFLDVFKRCILKAASTDWRTTAMTSHAKCFKVGLNIKLCIPLTHHQRGPHWRQVVVSDVCMSWVGNSEKFLSQAFAVHLNIFSLVFWYCCAALGFIVGLIIK